ncbi:DNA primase small subunit [uncultured Desulfatiglans sp.]|uniref:DNA primase small subunit n=1 Tax=Uncultured Desulfatiglans sp. TaxID=1748965 RepID=A0A653A992_UNCDX|nr:DNA primase small subunit [uncultured Desulfatiglans sp.]
MKTPAEAAPKRPAAPDFELLFSRLRSFIIENREIEKCREILRKMDVLQRLNPEQCLEWSRLAQMAGEMDVACRTLGDLNRRHPAFEPGWREHIELLVLLGKGAEAAALRARAQGAIPGFGQHDAQPVHTGDGGGDFQFLDEPFAAMKREERLIARYMALFQGREDCFARQWADRNAGTSGYVPVRRAIEPADVRDHLRGLKTYGIYLLRRDSRVATGVIDADLKQAYRTGAALAKERSGIQRECAYLVERVQELGKPMNLFALPEFSGGKGYHFWFFFEEPVPARPLKEALAALAGALRPDLTFFDLEVFPKQDQLGGKGLGNLVKLPLGLHRVTGKPSYFLQKRSGDVWQALEVLEGAAYSTLEKKDPPLGKTGSGGGVLIHPRQGEWIARFPELHRLSERCPPLGQLITACRNGKAMGVREEKILFATVGFLKRGKTLLHALLQPVPEYNPHLVDYKLSRLRGTPLGCRKIHTLLGVALDFCRFDSPLPYAHPLLHCREWMTEDLPVAAERVENLADALEHLRRSLDLVTRFLPAVRETS